LYNYLWCNEEWYNGVWFNGKCYNGVGCNGAWYNGEFYNGVVCNGAWYNGVWCLVEKYILSVLKIWKKITLQNYDVRSSGRHFRKVQKKFSEREETYSHIFQSAAIKILI